MAQSPQSTKFVPVGRSGSSPQLTQALDVINTLLNSPYREQVVAPLKEVLQARASSQSER